jgi:hypothetical protein
MKKEGYTFPVDKSAFNPIRLMQVTEQAILTGQSVDDALAALYEDMETSEEAKERLGIDPEE